jgi:hypothetical protein
MFLFSPYKKINLQKDDPESARKNCFLRAIEKASQDGQGIRNTWQTARQTRETR